MPRSPSVRDRRQDFWTGSHRLPGNRGGSVADLQARSSDHPFVVEKAYRQSADYTAAELDRGFHDLLRIEEGKINDTWFSLGRPGTRMLKSKPYSRRL